MAIPPRTPVLVGVGVASQREEDPDRALEPVRLMGQALARAGEDAGAPDLLRRADRIYVPRGFWDYADPGRLVTEGLGAAGARSVLAEIGVLQTTLFGHAARAIARGEAEVVLLAGGEAKYRSQRAQARGREAKLTAQPGATPDVVLRPDADLMHPLEIARGLPMPVRQYAVMENALRHAQGQSIAAHRREVAALWAGMSRIAAENPDAWSRTPVDAETIVGEKDGNRMLAFPYTKLHNAQWNVDQAAGLLLCSAERARAAGVPEARWVFPLAVAESNHIRPLIERRLLHRAPGFALAGRRVFQHAGLEPDRIAFLELYSCFPVAVRIQALELGIDAARPLTVTGGMAFAGGPLNNFVLQAAATLARRLRDAPGSHGLLTAVSGLLTKQGVSLWSSAPGAAPFAWDDVSEDTARALATCPVVEDAVGPARVAGYTVLHGRDGPEQAVAYCDLPEGGRTLAGTCDPDWIAEMERTELCGAPVRLGAAGRLLPG